MVRTPPIVMLAVVCLGTFVASVDLTIINVALPTFSRELKADNAQLQWIVDAYALTIAGFLLTAGALADRYGRRGWLILGLALFAATSAVAASIPSAGALIAARAAMGIATAIIFPTTLALIANIFVDPGQRAKAFGMWSALAGVGVAIGPIVGGWLLQHYWWGSVFWINVPISVFAITAATLVLPTSRDPVRSPIDLAGLVLSCVGVTALIYAIIQAPIAGWTSGRTAVGVGVAATVLAAFLWWERRTPHPMLDLSIFESRRFSGGTLAIGAAYLALFGFMFIMTQYLQFVTDYSAFEAGVRLLPVASSVAVASIVAPKLAERAGTTIIVAGGLTMFAAAMAWSGTFSADTPYWVVAAAMALLGGGLGLSIAPATEAVMGSLSPATAGVGSAVTGAVRQFGGSLGVAIVGSAFASIYSSKITNDAALAELDHRARGAMAESMAAAEHALGQLPLAQQAGVRAAVASAFLDGVWVSCLLCAGIGVAAAAVVMVLLPARGGSRVDELPPPEVAIRSPLAASVDEL